MNRDDVVHMAREAGIDPADMCEDPRIGENRLERFATLVAAAEREACAQVCDRGAEQMLHAYKREGAARCAEAIRARGQA